MPKKSHISPERKRQYAKANSNGVRILKPAPKTKKSK